MSTPAAVVHRQCHEGIGTWSTEEASWTREWVFPMPLNHMSRSVRKGTRAPKSMQVQLSRFFSWPCHWRRFAPHFSFMAKVHAFRAVLEGGAGGEAQEHQEGEPVEEPEPAARVSEPAAGASRKSRQTVQEEILGRLRELQTKKHTLDVVHEILQDGRVKIYAWMFRGWWLETGF